MSSSSTRYTISVFDSDEKEKKVENHKWQPSKHKVEEYKTLILKKITASDMLYNLDNKKIKPSKNIPFLEQYAGAAAFWSDREQVTEQLIKLNGLLIEEAKKYDLVTTNSSGHFIIKPAEDDKFYSAHQKILRHVLEREIAAFLFRKKLVKLEGELGTGIFLELVRNGYLFKDSGLRETTHGEFTHTLQWLMLAWQLEEYDFFNGVPVLTVYKSLGEESAILESAPLDIPGLREVGVNIWDIIVDIVPLYSPLRVNLGKPDVQQPYNHPDTDPRHFIVPYNLHYFLIHNTLPALSFLTSLISSRDIKREKESANELEISPTITPKLHKTLFPNTSYTRCFPNVLLPVDEKDAIYKKLALQTEIAEFPISTLTQYDDKFIKIHEKFMQATTLLNQKKYDAAIKIFKNIEKDFLHLSISQQQRGYYYLGYALTRVNQATSADIYLRKALYVSNQAERTDEITVDFIPKKNVLTELEVVQHIIRSKKDAALLQYR